MEKSEFYIQETNPGHGSVVNSHAEHFEWQEVKGYELLTLLQEHTLGWAVVNP